MTGYGDHCKREGEPIAAAHNPITVGDGDRAFDLAMGERRYEDIPVKAIGRFLARPEPAAIPGGGSGITGMAGSAGHRRGQGWSKAQG
jgi:hypothetical protein